MASNHEHATFTMKMLFRTKTGFRKYLDCVARNVHGQRVTASESQFIRLVERRRGIVEVVTSDYQRTILTAIGWLVMQRRPWWHNEELFRVAQIANGISH